MWCRCRWQQVCLYRFRGREARVGGCSWGKGYQHFSAYSVICFYALTENVYFIGYIQCIIHILKVCFFCCCCFCWFYFEFKNPNKLTTLAEYVSDCHSVTNSIFGLSPESGFLFYYVSEFRPPVQAAVLACSGVGCWSCGIEAEGNKYPIILEQWPQVSSGFKI